MHVNDSKAEFGSCKDRHENLGEGFIGKKALALLLTSAHFNKLPLILETPGFDDKGPDKQNVDILKSLIR
jgi:endonuclease IV